METLTGRTGRPILATACDRCSGRGFISAYRHVVGGTCFKCNGSGLVEVPQTYQRRLFPSINRMARAARAEA